MRSTGTHRLLKQGAKLVEGIEDILEEIRPLIRPSQSSGPLFGTQAIAGPVKCGSPNPLSESGPSEKILSRILDKVPKHIDEIAREAKITIQHAASVLLDLELRGLVCQLPGKYFISGR
jgi:DNA processing protein